MKNLFLKDKRVKDDKEFLKRVLERYRKQTPVSDFVKSLFKDETAETLSIRFKRAKESI